MARRSTRKSTKRTKKGRSGSRGGSHAKGSSRRWSARVAREYDSTHPREGLFTKSAETIAREMATKEVSPKGLGSAIRMVQFFINRGGKGLSKARRDELEKAKHLLQERREEAKSSSGAGGRGGSKTTSKRKRTRAAGARGRGRSRRTARGTSTRGA